MNEMNTHITQRSTEPTMYHCIRSYVNPIKKKMKEAMESVGIYGKSYRRFQKAIRRGQKEGAL